MKKALTIIFMLAALSPVAANEIINIEEAQKGMYAAVTQGFVFSPEVYDNCEVGFIHSQLLNPDEVPNIVKVIELTPSGNTEAQKKKATHYENDPGKLWFYYKIMSRRTYKVSVTVTELRTEHPEDGKFNVALKFYTVDSNVPFTSCTNDPGSVAVILDEKSRTDLRRLDSFKVGIEADFISPGAGGPSSPGAPRYAGTAQITVESK